MIVCASNSSNYYIVLINKEQASAIILCQQIDEGEENFTLRFVF